MFTRKTLNIISKDLSNNNEEISHLKNYDKNLLLGMKKLKNEKKILVKIKSQLLDKDTLTYLVESRKIFKLKDETMDNETSNT